MMDAHACKSGYSITTQNNKGKLADIKANKSQSGGAAAAHPSYTGGWQMFAPGAESAARLRVFKCLLMSCYKSG